MALPEIPRARPPRPPDPAARVPIAWGDHRDRTLIGAALIAGGAALVAQTTAFTLALGLIGSALHIAGWIVQPGRPLARTIAATAGVAACWCTVAGAQAMWPLAALLPCWLAVRRRPPVTALLTALPLAASFTAGSALPYVADKPIVFATTGAAVALGALAAREVAIRADAQRAHSDPIAARTPSGTPTPVD